jgi:mRNA interferase RelE/StbE
LKYRLVIPPHVEQTLLHLAPVLKRKIRAALEAIREEPELGKSLRDKLRGLRSYRVSRYRIVYRVHRGRIEIQVIDVGPRDAIYERAFEAIKKYRFQ